MKALRVLLSVSSVLLGAGLSLGAAWVILENQLFQLRGADGLAEVVKLEEQASGPRSRWPGSIFYSPVMRFRASSGREIEFRTGSGRNPPEYEVGEQVAITYSEANPHDVRVRGFAWSGVVMACLGSVLLVLGGRGFYGRHRDRKLLSTGTPIRTTFFRMMLNPAVSINDRHPWVIVTHWQDPSTRAKRFFNSENLWSEPTSRLSEGPILVYVDPERPAKYVMDLSGEALARGNVAVPTVEEEARVLRGPASEQPLGGGDSQSVSAFILDGSELGLCLDGPHSGRPETPKDILKRARGSRVFVHFDRRKASGAGSIDRPAHAVLLIEGDFGQVKIGAKRLTCALEGGEKCAVPWEAIFAVVVQNTAGIVWLRQAPAEACITDCAEPLWRGADVVAELALARQLPTLAVNGEQVPDGKFQLLVDGDWFPGITSVGWGGVLGFFVKLRLGGSTGPLLSYVRARARAEKHPAFYVELTYETSSTVGQGAFTGCAWTVERTDELDTLIFRPASFQFSTQAKRSGFVRSSWGH